MLFVAMLSSCDSILLPSLVYMLCKLEVRGLWHLLLWHIMKCNNNMQIFGIDAVLLLDGLFPIIKNKELSVCTFFRASILHRYIYLSNHMINLVQ